MRQRRSSMDGDKIIRISEENPRSMQFFLIRLKRVLYKNHDSNWMGRLLAWDICELENEANYFYHDNIHLNLLKQHELYD